jgi:hypothetical protein
MYSSKDETIHRIGPIFAHLQNIVSFKNVTCPPIVLNDVEMDREYPKMNRSIVDYEHTKITQTVHIPISLLTVRLFITLHLIVLLNSDKFTLMTAAIFVYLTLVPCGLITMTSVRSSADNITRCREPPKFIYFIYFQFYCTCDIYYIRK